jgi:hypothetical protein
MGLYYIAHRLFSAHDRALGAYVARRLARDVGGDAVFLPFCDTDEEDLTDSCKGRRLFELDRERLRRVDGMLAVLHGPSLDDGVCMEIGYAAALGVPVVALTTDFQTYGLTRDGAELTFPDPLLDVLLTEVVRVHKLAGAPAGTPDRFDAFMDRNLRTLHAAADQAITALLRAQPLAAGSLAPAVEGEPTAFIEPSPYLERGLWTSAARLLASHEWSVHQAGRFRASADLCSAARADWAAFTKAGLALVDVSGPEAPPGAALVIGACAATGRTVLAADPGGPWTFADGREANWRNLMIQYAVSDRFATVADLAALLGER